jgi:hypothetical protein
MIGLPCSSVFDPFQFLLEKGFGSIKTRGDILENE